MMASHDAIGKSSSTRLTMTVLGCGTMGIAILSGIMMSLNEGTADNSEEDTPKQLPGQFRACVRSPGSAKKIKQALNHYGLPLEVTVNDNVESVQKADIVLLGCKPYMFRDVLGAEGILEALEGKILISILAGVTAQQLEEQLYPGEKPKNACRVVRAMTNTASFVREGMTVVEMASPPLDPEQLALVTWIFNRIGKVSHLPASVMDASTALCGSGTAFMALVLESLADGAVAMGLPRAEAQLMAAQVMRGTTGLVLSGEHPAVLKDKVSTPGGCTIGGLMVLEEGKVRGTVSRAIREATVVASELGKGTKNVNGPRR